MARTAALMLVALLVVSAFVSSSASATDSKDVLPAASIPGEAVNAYTRGCSAIHRCRGGGRKLLEGSNVEFAMQEAEKVAKDLKEKMTSLFH